MQICPGGARTSFFSFKAKAVPIWSVLILSIPDKEYTWQFKDTYEGYFTKLKSKQYLNSLILQA